MKAYWIICVRSYCVDGKEIPKGRMEHTQARFPIGGYWRKATEEEINTRQWHKGNWFNLKNV